MTATTDNAVIEQAPPRRSRRRLVLVLAAVVVLVGAGVVTAFVTSFHYLHAAPLSTNGGGWLPPDDAHVRQVQAGPYSASVVPARPGHRQTFEINLYNSSDVTQTVLGEADAATLTDPTQTGEPEYVAVSTKRTFPQPARAVRFTSRPVAIPPHGQYSLRWSEVTDARLQHECRRTEDVQGVRLRVRVGAFTRTETVDLGDLIFEIRSIGPC